MTSARQVQKGSVSIRSQTYWSLLGLIIERPDYGYSLLQRFKREFDEALPLSTDSHVYEGLKALERAGLIQEYASPRRGRQTSPRYRASPDGVRGYADWLTARIRVERFRSRLFARQLAALEGVPALGLEVIEQYERACLEDDGPSLLASSGDSLAVALPAEQARLAAQAELPWVSYARKRFTKLVEGR